MLTASVRPRLSALTFRSGLLVELAFFRNGKPINLFEDQLPDRHVLAEHKRDWSEVNDLQGDRPLEPRMYCWGGEVDKEARPGSATLPFEPSRDASFEGPVCFSMDRKVQSLNRLAEDELIRFERVSIWRDCLPLGVCSQEFCKIGFGLPGTVKIETVRPVLGDLQILLESEIDRVGVERGVLADLKIPGRRFRSDDDSLEVKSLVDGDVGEDHAPSLCAGWPVWRSVAFTVMC